MLKHKRTSIKIPKSSIVLDMDMVFKTRNIQKPFTYLVKLGLNTATVSKMLKGKAVQLNFQQLTTICLNLNCTPNDLFSLREIQLPENHALQVLPVYVPDADEPTVSEWLAGKTVEEVKELMRK